MPPMKIALIASQRFISARRRECLYRGQPAAGVSRASGTSASHRCRRPGVYLVLPASPFRRSPAAACAAASRAVSTRNGEQET